MPTRQSAGDSCYATHMSRRQMEWPQHTIRSCRCRCNDHATEEEQSEVLVLYCPLLPLTSIEYAGEETLMIEMPNPRIKRATMNCAMCLAVAPMIEPTIITQAPEAIALRRPNLSVITAANVLPMKLPLRMSTASEVGYTHTL